MISFETYELSDIELSLLNKKKIEFDNDMFLYPIDIDEIFDLKYSKYSQYINVLTLDSDSIKEKLKTNEEVTTYQYLITVCIYNDEARDLIIQALEFFLKQKVFISDLGFIIGECDNPKEDKFLLINEDNYERFKWFLKKSNCLDVEEKINKKTDEKLQEYLNKLKEIKKDMNLDNQNNNDITLHDIISSICARHNSYTLDNIKHLTMYQLIDQFKRLHKLDEYFININALIHGASSKDNELIHYTSKLK